MCLSQAPASLQRQSGKRWAVTPETWADSILFDATSVTGATEFKAAWCERADAAGLDCGTSQP